MDYFSKVGMFLLVLACGFLLTSHPVRCNEHEDYLLQEINKYRKSHKLCALTRNEKAACLGDRIANGLQDYPGYGPDDFPGNPSTTVLKFVNFPKLVRKCHINVTTTMDVVILSVCIDELKNDHVRLAYTNSSYTKYLRNSVYTGVGIGSETNWIVMVLSTDEQSGSISAATTYLVAIRMIHYFYMVLSWGVFLSLCWHM